MSVIELYRHALENRGYLADASQMQAVERLQQLHEEWSAYKGRRSSAVRKLLVRPPLPRGVYLWGAALPRHLLRRIPRQRHRRRHDPRTAPPAHARARGGVLHDLQLPARRRLP